MLSFALNLGKWFQRQTMLQTEFGDEALSSDIPIVFEV
jgi:hypothetical protein